MKISTMLRKTASYTLIFSMLSMSLQSSVFAAVVGNDQLAVESEMQIQRDEVKTFLARQDVRAGLVNAGVNSKDVDARINNLSDAQVLQIHNKMGELPAGGEGVLGVILVVLVIFILLDVAGVTDVFPGV